MAGRSYSLHQCTAKGCSTRVDTSKLMCPTRWRQVPADLQAKVYSTFRAYSRAVDDSTSDDGFYPAKNAYYAARREAIAAVAAAEGRAAP